RNPYGMPVGIAEWRGAASTAHNIACDLDHVRKYGNTRRFSACSPAGYERIASFVPDQKHSVYSPQHARKLSRARDHHGSNENFQLSRATPARAGNQANGMVQPVRISEID